MDSKNKKMDLKPQSVKVNWSEQKAKLRAKFPVLTDRDLMFEEGKKGEMFEKLQTKLGKTKEEFQKILAGL